MLPMAKTRSRWHGKFSRKLSCCPTATSSGCPSARTLLKTFEGEAPIIEQTVAGEWLTTRFPLPLFHLAVLGCDSFPGIWNLLDVLTKQGYPLTDLECSALCNWKFCELHQVRHFKCSVLHFVWLVMSALNQPLSDCHTVRIPWHFCIHSGCSGWTSITRRMSLQRVVSDASYGINA